MEVPVLRKLLLVAAVAGGGLMATAAPAQAVDYNVIYKGTYPTVEECVAAGEAGLAAGWDDYRCHYTNLLQYVFIQ